MRWLVIMMAMILCGCTSSKPTTAVGKADNYRGKIYVDKFDNVYAITPQHEVVKYGDDGEVQFLYSNRLMGDITHLDVTNPQLVVAYVETFGILIILDNTLAELSTKNLVQLGYTDVSAVAVSNDGNYWLYDEANWRLLKVTRAGEIIAESNRLSDFIPQQATCSYMVERGNKVYLSTDDGRLLIFDNLGSFMNSLSLPGIGRFSISGEQVMYLYDGQVQRYHMKFFTSSAAMFDGLLPDDAVDMDVTSKGQPVFLTADAAIVR